MDIAALSAQNILWDWMPAIQKHWYVHDAKARLPLWCYLQSFPAMTNNLEMFVCGHVVFIWSVSKILTGEPGKFNDLSHLFEIRCRMTLLNYKWHPLWYILWVYRLTLMFIKQQSNRPNTNEFWNSWTFTWILPNTCFAYILIQTEKKPT